MTLILSKIWSTIHSRSEFVIIINHYKVGRVSIPASSVPCV